MAIEDKAVCGDQKDTLRTRDIFALIFLVILLSLSLYMIFTVLNFPLWGGRIVAYLILLPSLFLSIFLAIGLLRHFISFAQKRWIFTLFQILIAFLLPFILIGMIEERVKEKALTVVQGEISSVITYIDKYKKKNGNLPQDIIQTLSNSSTLSNITYYAGIQDFMLETDVPSIDIDGNKIFYDSRDMKWYEFHNDEYQYYQDKKEKPESITRYISLQKQMKAVERYIPKTNGAWSNTKAEAKMNSEKHLKSHKESCESSHGASCTAVGMRYAMGLEVAQNDSEALKYFTKACELDDGNGCHYLADLYAQGKGVQKSSVKAQEYYKKACDLGTERACHYMMKK